MRHLPQIFCFIFSFTTFQILAQTSNGEWWIDNEDENAEIFSFEIEDQEQDYGSHCIAFQEAVNFSVDIKSNISICRSFYNDQRSLNLKSFETLKFDASGMGSLQITLVKESIDIWENQVSTVVNLDHIHRQKELTLAHFYGQEGPKDLDDITMVVFTLLGNHNNYDEKELNIEGIHFEKEPTFAPTVNLNEKAIETMSVFPNPAIDQIQIDHADMTENSICYILNNQGKVLKEINGSSNRIDVSDLASGQYFIQKLDTQNGERSTITFLKAE